MISPLLALFIRSLREDSRQRLAYIARSGLVLVILLFLYSTQSEMGWSNAPGLEFFNTVVNIDLCFVVLAGIGYFSSAISEEKEETTLGLLRMTNLNPLSILLGKSTSRLCSALLLFAAQIPFTMLAITLGGISLHQILSAYLALAAFLVLVCNLALLGSVVCRRTAGAAGFTIVGMLILFLFLPFARVLSELPERLGLVSAANWWTSALEVVGEAAKSGSAFFRLDAILKTGFNESAFSFQAWSNCALGSIFFLTAWGFFERFSGPEKESGPGRAATAHARSRSASFFSPGRTWNRALAWKDFYFHSGGKLWLVIKLLIYGTPLLAVRCWPQRLGGPPPWSEFAGVMFWLMAGFIAVELLFAAASVFRIERQGQTLSSLAMLPQGLRRVAYHKLLGIVPSLLPAAFYLVLSLPLMPNSIRETINDLTDDSRHWLEVAAVLSQGVFFLHLVANLSLRVKRGALPLSIGIYFLLILFMRISASGVSDESSILFLILTPTIGVTIFLHFNTGSRLTELAAEE